MEADSGQELTALKVDGGASANNFIMQFQADLMDIKVVRTPQNETTALGAAYLAGIACGFWDSREEVASLASHGDVFTASMSGLTRERLLAGWRAAVRKAISR